MSMSKNDDAGGRVMPAPDSRRNEDSSIASWSKDEHPKGAITGDMRIDRRSFTACLFAAPFVMKAGLAAALDVPAARAESDDALQRLRIALAGERALQGATRILQVEPGLLQAAPLD